MPLTSSERFQAGLSVGGAGLMGFQERLAEITRRKELDEERRRDIEERRDANLALASIYPGLREKIEGMGDAIGYLPAEAILSEGQKISDLEAARQEFQVTRQLFPGEPAAQIDLSSGASASTYGLLSRSIVESGLARKAMAGVGPFLSGLASEAGAAAVGLEDLPPELADEAVRGYFGLIEQKRVPVPSGGIGVSSVLGSEDWMRALGIAEKSRTQLEQSIVELGEDKVKALGLELEEDDKGNLRLTGNVDAAISQLAGLQLDRGGASPTLMKFLDEPDFRLWFSDSFWPLYSVRENVRGILETRVPGAIAARDTAQVLPAQGLVPAPVGTNRLREFLLSGIRPFMQVPRVPGGFVPGTIPREQPEQRPFGTTIVTNLFTPRP